MVYQINNNKQNYLGMNAIIYVRVSDTKQVRDGISLELQEKECVARAEHHNLNIVKIYKDAGVSGKSEYRDGFMEMMADINENPSAIDFVIFYNFTRLGRRALDVLLTVEELTRMNIDIISLGNNLDTKTPEGKFSLTLFASLAELESSQLRERVVPAMRYKAEQGGWNGGRHIPYGYKNIIIEGQEIHANGRTKKILTPLEEEAEQIRLIFSLYINIKERSKKLGHHRITRSIIETGNKYRGGKEWTTKKVSSVVENVALYAGFIEWGRYRTQYKKYLNPITKKWENELSTIGKNKGKPVIQRIKNDEFIYAKGKHEAIIDEETYKIVLEIKKNNMPTTTRNKGRNATSLLTGVIVCPDCNTPLIGHVESHGQCYKCRVAVASPGTCNYNTIKEEHILPKIYDVFFPYFKYYIYSSIPKMILEKTKKNKVEISQEELVHARINNRITEIHSQLQELYNHFKNKVMVLEVYNNEKKPLEDEVESLKYELTTLAKKVNYDNSKLHELDIILEEVNKFENIEEYFLQLPIQTKIDYFRFIFKSIHYSKLEGKTGRKSVILDKCKVNFIFKEIQDEREKLTEMLLNNELDKKKYLRITEEVNKKLGYSYADRMDKSHFEIFINENLATIEYVDTSTGEQVYNRRKENEITYYNNINLQQQLSLDDKTSAYNETITNQIMMFENFVSGKHSKKAISTVLNMYGEDSIQKDILKFIEDGVDAENAEIYARKLNKELKDEILNDGLSNTEFVDDLSEPIINEEILFKFLSDNGVNEDRIKPLVYGYREFFNKMLKEKDTIDNNIFAVLFNEYVQRYLK